MSQQRAGLCSSTSCETAQHHQSWVSAPASLQGWLLLVLLFQPLLLFFHELFLQSHALTKEGLLLGSPGDSVCPFGVPVGNSCSVLWFLTREDISGCAPGSLHTFLCHPGPPSWSHSTLHMTVGAGCWSRERAGSPAQNTHCEPPG